MRRRLIPILCILLLRALVSPLSGALAQNNAPQPIRYGQEVSGSITDQSFFEQWQLSARAHDQIYVRMTGSDGLRPLIGILDSGGTLLAHSGNGDADSPIDMTYEVQQDGTYLIVATRVDNHYGTTTGTYTLSVENLNPVPTRDPRFQDVTFQCGASDATAAATVHFAREDTDNGAYSLRVYGLDGFQPVIRVQSGSTNLCLTDPADALGDVITLPGERPVTLTQDDLSHTAQGVINGQNADDPTSITVTIGSAGDQSGRYLAVIGGFSIEPSTDTDNYDVRLAPRPAQASADLLFYAIGVNNRLDPSVISESGRCDDAGRRGCEDVPVITNAGVIFNFGVSVIGDRFDAGVRISDADPHRVQVLSFSGTTHGEYAVMLIGSLPPPP